MKVQTISSQSRVTMETRQTAFRLTVASPSVPSTETTTGRLSAVLVPQPMAEAGGSSGNNLLSTKSYFRKTHSMTFDVIGKQVT